MLVKVAGADGMGGHILIYIKVNARIDGILPRPYSGCAECATDACSMEARERARLATLSSYCCRA